MVQVTFRGMEEDDSGGKEMVVQGHAGYAESGKDIVCAGVSAVATSLQGYVKNSGIPNSSTVEKGGGFLKVTVDSSSEALDAAFTMALIGMLQIEMTFPDYVSVQSL